MAWFWGCAGCHAREHAEGGFARDELWAAKRYSHDERVLLILLGWLAVFGKTTYDQVVERGEWAEKDPTAWTAAKQMVKWRELGGAVACYLNKLTHQRPVPAWIKKAMGRVR